MIVLAYTVLILIYAQPQPQNSLSIPLEHPRGLRSQDRYGGNHSIHQTTAVINQGSLQGVTTV